MKRILILLFVISYGFAFVFSVTKGGDEPTSSTMFEDVSGLMPVKVQKILEGKEEESIRQVVKDAKEQGLKVSIAGKRHSMGGHTYYTDAIVLDMTSYNKILNFDVNEKTITVQSGATWNDIQQYINPYGLAVKVMQSQNIFTVGGSMSVNAHGRDIRYGSLIDTIRSFRLLQANGQIIHVSREENEELFYLVNGGYGLFGVILEVEIQLTEDELYTTKTKEMNYDQYTDYFKREVLENEQVRMHLARISTSPQHFLTDMYVTDYMLAADQTSVALEEHNELKSDEMTWLTKFLLGLSRSYDWGKNLLWEMQESYFLKTNGNLVTRNNVMRSESKFLEYEDESDTDVLQEYFVPIEQFADYMDDLREVLTEEDLNLINITIRYVQEDETAVLSYAKKDMFALVLLINQGLSKEESAATQSVVQKMIDVTLDHGGSYYLPYMPYATKDQMREAYPRSEEFFIQKRKYDSDELFYNFFYEEYK
ncbi:FAD-binding oxidoreductase [Bacillus mesophilus]|uniref:FAD-binding oxidoreductase n=1 Tax=Bacillus mesophilus TaxID=1808955 RepID=A0A6M0Q6U9_9BACI|nr:FAD-binding oxidoreductase [Bacillus mesophilus]NEY71479.1 FAD-binding oxidoreductase [Bacillus mesophilus]